MTQGNFFIENKITRGRTLCTLDLWSCFLESCIITNVATTVALPPVNIECLPSGITLVRATAFLKFRVVSEWGGLDAELDGGQPIKVMNSVGGVWHDAIELTDGLLKCTANGREFGDVFVGNDDVKEQLPGNGGQVVFEWYNSKTTAGILHIEDVQTGLRIWFSV